MSTKIISAGIIYLSKIQFETLVEKHALIPGAEYRIIDNRFTTMETFNVADWIELTDEGNYSAKITSKTIYSAYRRIDLLGTFDIGKYGIVMHSLDEDGRIVFYAINKPAVNITATLEVSR